MSRPSSRRQAGGVQPLKGVAGLRGPVVGGKRVLGRDGCGVVGQDLLPHSDDSVAVFDPGKVAEAEHWLRSYGWGSCPDFEMIMRRLREGLGGAKP